MLNLIDYHNNELSRLYFQDNFFVITSEDVMNNCTLGGEVESRLYGYAILEDRIYINSRNCNFPFPMDTCGSFVNVVSDGESIKIYQDYFGSYGLYLYCKDGYWAISNAFLYLAEYLRDKKQSLSIDSTFAMTMIAPPTSSLAYKRTLINEIEMLPRDCYISIEKQSGKYIIIRQKQRESYIPIESKEAVDLLDRWHRKWNRLFQVLAKRNLMFSLSGGKDSRASLACLFSPRIDMDNVPVYSQKDTLSTHADDYRIAKEIADIYDFQLHGQDIRFERYLMDPWDQLKAMIFIKGGFNREIMPFHFYQQQPVFRITGSGGDLRELWNETPENYIKRQLGAISFHSLNVRGALKAVMEESKQQIDEDYRDLYSSLTANEYFYRYGRQRNHNGKANVEVFMGNTVILSPLMDPLLYKINQDTNDGTDRDLLYALIYERYVPELDAVPFDSNRIVIEPTKAKAKEINTKYPFKSEQETLSLDFGLSIGKRIPPMRYEGNVRALDCLRELFESEDMKQAICTEYGEEIYEWAANYWAHKPWHPYMPASALTAFYVAYSSVCASSMVGGASSEDTKKNAGKSNYFNDGITKEILDYLQAARIEIKNVGAESNTVVLDKCDDENLFMESPKWFKDDKGEGKLFQSRAGKLTLDFHAVGDGKLKISLKGPWAKDSQGKPVPIKVDFRKIILNENGNTIIANDDVTTVDTSKPVLLERDCSDGMQYSLYLEWFPYIYSPDEFCNLYRALRTNFVDFFKFWRQIGTKEALVCEYESCKRAPVSEYPRLLKVFYKKHTGRELDLDHPKDFNEKIQWLKLYDSTPLKTQLADKYLARDWIENRIGKGYVVPLLGVWNSFSDINFSKLPNRFVLKCTHGSGWNLIVTDKNELDIEAEKKKFDRWMSINFAFTFGLELHYKKIFPRIIAEEYLESSKGIIDYRFFCFNGNPMQVWVDIYSGTSKHLRSIYDMNWNKIPMRCTWPDGGELLDNKPVNFEEMNRISKILSKDFMFVRVDFFEINQKIYVGELTFTPMSGVGKFIPREWDRKLGDMLRINALDHHIIEGR